MNIAFFAPGEGAKALCGDARRRRQAELNRISAQAELGSQDDRTKRTREVVVEERREQRQAREALSQDELATVNREAQRIAEQIDGGPGRAAVARALAGRVAAGQPLIEAVFATLNEQKQVPGVVLSIEEVSEVAGEEVSVAGQVIELWDPSSPSIQQVGLIADDSS